MLFWGYVKQCGKCTDVVIARLRVGWGKFKDLSSVLRIKDASLKMKKIVLIYKAHMRSGEVLSDMELKVGP